MSINNTTITNTTTTTNTTPTKATTVTAARVRRVRNLYFNKWLGTNEVAQKTGLSRHQVYRIVNGKAYTSVA
jgi:DNA-binding transcriptional regulator LsrR (DeoR family)